MFYKNPFVYLSEKWLYYNALSGNYQHISFYDSIISIITITQSYKVFYTIVENSFVQLNTILLRGMNTLISSPPKY